MNDDILEVSIRKMFRIKIVLLKHFWKLLKPSQHESVL